MLFAFLLESIIVECLLNLKIVYINYVIMLF